MLLQMGDPPGKRIRPKYSDNNKTPTVLLPRTKNTVDFSVTYQQRKSSRKVNTVFPQINFLTDVVKSYDKTSFRNVSPSKHPYHPRSNSPTYKLLIKVTDKLEAMKYIFIKRGSISSSRSSKSQMSAQTKCVFRRLVHSPKNKHEIHLFIPNEQDPCNESTESTSEMSIMIDASGMENELAFEEGLKQFRCFHTSFISRDSPDTKFVSKSTEQITPLMRLKCVAHQCKMSENDSKSSTDRKQDVRVWGVETIHKITRNHVTGNNNRSVGRRYKKRHTHSPIGKKDILDNVLTLISLDDDD